VVGKFVEFFGPGLEHLPVADRATVANMAPEYGATVGFFPVDEATLEYLRFSGRDPAQIKLCRAYLREQGLLRHGASPSPNFSSVVELDLASVQPSLAGPKRPQDRVALAQVKSSFAAALPGMLAGKSASATGGPARISVEVNGRKGELQHGSVVIAAITSCTNTSNPSVMMAAGLLAKKAVARGLTSKPWVKSSLAPGSKVVSEYLTQAGLTPFLEQLGFHTVGYGCTTCIGNSGPLPDSVGKAIEKGNLVVAAVLSGNRNFEGRVHAQVRANYLASPPLVVAYALAGRVDFDPTNEPLGTDKNGAPVYLKEVWPTREELQQTIGKHVTEAQFKRTYAEVFSGSEAWRALNVPSGDTYTWDSKSTYVKRAPYFDDMGRQPEPFRELEGARVLAYLGDSITTDHISPAGSIKHGSPAAQWLVERGVAPADYNQYGARRGHDEVMVRGTFANVRLQNRLVPGVEGGETLLLPDEKRMTIFDASVIYRERRVPLVVLAGKEYGSGSSRDWAAKGPYLLGVRAVLAESYERIHRSNLVGMGIVPLEFPAGQSAESLGLSGRETYDFIGLASGIAAGFSSGKAIGVRVTPSVGQSIQFEAHVRIDTPTELEYVRHGNILRYVLRRLL
jgi:aconitate hydratase